MDAKSIIFLCLIAYALGSITTSVWLGKLIFRIDVREHGSGNAGATNTIRVFGWWTGIPVLLIDMAKGYLAALLPILIFSNDGFAFHTIKLQTTNIQILTGIFSILGHVFPAFAGFKGGKGVATSFGVLLALSPHITLLCIGVFIVTLLITGYVSASSVSAGISFPVFIFTLLDSPTLILKIFSVVVGLAIIATHNKNISRLIKGEEKRFIWKKKNKNE